MLKLEDLCRAPLDGVYAAIKDRNTAERMDIIRNNFRVIQTNNPNSIRKHGGVLHTMRPLEHALQFKDATGTLREIRGPAVAFENQTYLNVREMMVDFGAKVTAVKRRANNELDIRVGNPCSSGERGRMSDIQFNVTYKNDLPPGIEALQGVYKDVIKDQYAAIRSGNSTSTEEKFMARVESDILITRLENRIRKFNELVHADTRDNGAIVRLLVAIHNVCEQEDARIRARPDVLARFVDVVATMPDIHSLLEKGIVVETHQTDVSVDAMYDVFKLVPDPMLPLFSVMYTLRGDGTWVADMPADVKTYTFVAAPSEGTD